MMELIVFISGFSVMVLELAGARVIAPFLGSTYIVWTSIIGIIMAALSIGYYIGGKLSDKKTSSIILSMIFFTTGVFIIILSFFQFDFLKYILKLQLNIYIMSIIVGTSLFGIPSILLGTITPYTINFALTKRKISSEERGKEIGKFYAFSTIGSILGTFLCGFYLILFFGIKSIFLFLGLLLLISSLSILISYIIQENKKLNFRLFIYCIIQIVLILSVFFSIYDIKKSNIPPIPNTIESFDSPYGYIGIIDIETKADQEYNNKKIKKIRFLTNYANIERGTHSAIYITDKGEIIQAFKYIDFFHKIYEMKDNKQSILLLGIGGNGLLNNIFNSKDKREYYNSSFDLIEIDPFMIKIAKKYFFFKESNNLKIYIKDARLYINELVQKRKRNKYDIIFHDIYNSDVIVPFETITIEALEEMKYLLKDDGILVINIVASIESKYFKQICKQLYTVFPYVKIYPTYTKDKEPTQNIIFVGLKNTQNNNKKLIDKLQEYEIEVEIPNNILPYTDNYAPFDKLIHKRA